MMIDTQSEAMKWILSKCLMDSLEFLAHHPQALRTKRSEWIESFQKKELTEERIKEWMPYDNF